MNGFYFQVSTVVVCLICSCRKDLVILWDKGANGMNRAAEKRGSALRAYIVHILHVQYECRRNFTNPTQINIYLNELNENAAALYPKDTPVLRSAHTFSFRTQCLFCGQHGTLRGKNGTTMYFQNNRLSTCSYAYLSFKRRCMG